MRKILLFALIAAFSISCSTASKEYSKDTFEKDIVELKKELSAEDAEILGKSIMRSVFQKTELEGKTYSEIIKEGKDWEAQQAAAELEQKLLAEKALKEEQERIDKLRQSVVVSCFDKGFQKYGYEDYITYKFAVQNKSDKDFRAIKGTIIFTDLFDDEITQFSFKYDQPIKAGQSITWDATTDYNQFIDKDKAMRNKDLKDLKVIWQPEKIIFEDGSTLE